MDSRTCPPRLLPWCVVATALAVTLWAVGDTGGLEKGRPKLDHASRAANQGLNCHACHHSGGTNKGGGSAAVVGVPRKFNPGQVYRIRVRTEETGRTVWGYQLTATDALGNAVGTFSNPDANSQIDNNGILQFVSQTDQGSFTGVPNGPVFWEVDWTAPASGTAYFWTSTLAGDSDGSEFGDSTYNFGRASVDPSISREGTIMVQPDYPNSGLAVLSLGSGDAFESEIRVSNHLATTQTYLVGTRVQLPGGAWYPSSGYLSTDTLNLAPGQTGTVSFSQVIPPVAPIGAYQFHAFLGTPPNNLVDSFSVGFNVIP